VEWSEEESGEGEGGVLSRSPKQGPYLLQLMVHTGLVKNAWRN